MSVEAEFVDPHPTYGRQILLRYRETETVSDVIDKLKSTFPKVVNCLSGSVSERRANDEDH